VSAALAVIFTWSTKTNPAGPNLQEPEAAANQYIFQIEKAGLLSFPVPDIYSLENLTLTVARNNRFTVKPDNPIHYGRECGQDSQWVENIDAT
jgi:hypothetical protein